MWLKRRLLYHRGVDDHIGTYVTDYVFSGVCFLLCVQLLARMRRERRRMTREQRMTSSCVYVTNWLPWNWPKAKPTPIAMSTVGVVLMGFANAMMALLGGLTHQFVQTVEPYKDAGDLGSWLVVWRGAASFSACLCLGVLLMAEQLIMQEGLVRFPRLFRIGYYVTMMLACLALFGYNYTPLVGKVEDPFSVKESFVITFGVMLLYGVVTIAVAMQHIFCVTGHRTLQEGQEISHSHSRLSDIKRPERRPYRKTLYSCYKGVVVRCHGSAGNVTSRKWELILTVISPWMYVAAGVLNHFLKSKCADADHASMELGCPLPDVFNHNAMMHVMQIFSLIGFFLTENLAMTRRRNVNNVEYRRIVTSSSLPDDVIDCSIASAETCSCFTNNNIPNSRDDVICEMALKYAQLSDDVTMPARDVTTDPKFPTNFNREKEYFGNRLSVYDNVEPSVVTFDSNPGQF